jgi:hypothetical protein
VPPKESGGSLSCTAEYGLPSIELLTNETTVGSNWKRKLTTPASPLWRSRTCTLNSDWLTTGPAGPRAYRKLSLAAHEATLSPLQ